MIIRVHRWQPNQDRFHVQKFELWDDVGEPTGDDQTFLGFDFDKRARQNEGFKNFRSQHVDRIEVNTLEGTLDIFTSPIIDRPYKVKSKAPDPEVAMSVYTPLSASNSGVIENPVCDYCRVALRFKGSKYCSLECEMKDAHRKI